MTDNQDSKRKKAALKKLICTDDDCLNTSLSEQYTNLTRVCQELNNSRSKFFWSYSTNTDEYNANYFIVWRIDEEREGVANFVIKGTYEIEKLPLTDSILPFNKTEKLFSFSIEGCKKDIPIWGMFRLFSINFS